MLKCIRVRGAYAAFAAVILFAAVLLISKRSEAVTASSDKSAESVSLPVIMYHSVLSDPSRTGEYVITPEELEKDLIYIMEKGMNTVTPDMIISFVDNGTPLPEKPVMLTFDDGHLNNMTYVLPLLEKYDMYATVNTVGIYTLNAEKENDPNPYYAYLTREDISALDREGHFDIVCAYHRCDSL